MNIEQLISSQAKLLCLKVMLSFQEPIHLRRIVNLTGLQVRSVQLALNFFKSIKLVKQSSRANKIEYQFNKTSANFFLIESFFKELNSTEIKMRSSSYTNFIASVTFIEDSKELFNSIK